MNTIKNETPEPDYHGIQKILFEMEGQPPLLNLVVNPEVLQAAPEDKSQTYTLPREFSLYPEEELQTPENSLTYLLLQEIRKARKDFIGKVSPVAVPNDKVILVPELPVIDLPIINDPINEPIEEVIEVSNSVVPRRKPGRPKGSVARSPNAASRRAMRNEEMGMTTRTTRAARINQGDDTADFFEALP